MLNVFLKIFAHHICRAYVILEKRGGIRKMSEFYFGYICGTIGMVIINITCSIIKEAVR